MSLRFKRMKQRQEYIAPWGNTYWHLWFLYHKKLYGALLCRGKKAQAFNFLVRIKYQLKLREFFDPYYLLLVIMLKITPDLDLVQKRMGGSYKSIAVPITAKKKITLSVRWVVKLLRDNYRIITLDHIVDLLYDALYDKGAAIEKKEECYTLAAATRFLLRRLFR